MLTGLLGFRVPIFGAAVLRTVVVVVVIVVGFALQTTLLPVPIFVNPVLQVHMIVLVFRQCAQSALLSQPPLLT